MWEWYLGSSMTERAGLFAVSIGMAFQLRRWFREVTCGYLVNQRSGIIHRRGGCKYGPRTLFLFRLGFRTLEEAEAAGYRPCMLCEQGDKS